MNSLKVAGDLLMNWRCALSCSSMLIPLLLTSLEDESPSNREEIWQIWNEVGKKWLVEELDRDHRLKEQVDFQAEAPPPSHYPPESKTKVLFLYILYYYVIIRNLKMYIQGKNETALFCTVFFTGKWTFSGKMPHITN